MKRKNTILKWVALSMALALIIMSLPVQALERSGIGTEDSISDLPFSGLDNNGDDDVFVVEEDQAKRGQFEKHYLCSDGTYVAVTYPEAVHYLGEDHTWQDVNLSLAYDDISGLYQNEMSDFAVSFSEKASGSEMVSIENGKYFLSWGIQISSVSISDMEGDANDLHSRTSEKSMAPQADICAKVGDMPISKKYEKMSDRLVGDEDVFALPNVSSQISYTGIWGEKQKASLKYTIYHHKIEEDFIIYERGDFGSMSMNMNVGTLMPIVNGDGSVDFVDCDGIMQFHIGIPYVMDAAGSVCNDIQVNAEKKEGTCLITYTPDSSWLDSQERVFPILLDPSITTSEYVANMQDTYVEENSTANHMSEQYLYINTNGSNRRNAIIRISKLPVIDESMPIVSAKLTLTAQYASFNTVLLKAAYYDTALDLSDYQYDVLEYLPISFTAYNYLNAGATTVSFDFTPHAYEMYEDESFDMERGDIYQGDFIIGYSDSNETPFVYPFFSSGYTTASSRPVFTVKYGYTLPAGILDGGIYSFQNVASFSYMTVNGMSPANNSNIYQVYNDDGIAIMTQKFKLEYVASTGGYRLRAMSSSSGTDKVVDIQRAGGSIYSGRNVQIYSATDPISQEWLIVPVDYDVFRIVPRANMALTLTAYGYDDGTNSGKTSTSPGNIFVQTIEPHNPFQQWYIYDNDDSEINTQHFRATIDSGNYYLSNSYTGKYLHRSGNVSNCMRGTISSLGDETVKWKVVNLGDGYCTIQRSDLPGYYLAPTSNSSGSGVKLYNNSSETIPNKYKWLIRTVSGGGCLIQNKESGFYLYSLDQSSNPSSVCVYPLFSAGSTDYKKETWRVISEENYVEFGYGSSFNDIPLGIGETSRASVNRQPTRAHWASYEDFDYTIVSGGEYVSYDAGTKTFGGLSYGKAQVKAQHKVTGIVRYFTVHIVKPAIIILPGIMGSQIFAADEITLPSSHLGDFSNQFSCGTRLWDPSIYQPLLIDEKIKALKCDSSGNPVYPTYVNPPTVNQYDLLNGFQYGATDLYRPLYNVLYENFHDDYDIVLYEYDWRKDPYDTATELSNFIMENNYGKIVFVSHSMGGLVSSYYLAKGSTQQMLVDKHISIGTPYLGSVEMPYIYVTGNIRDAVWQNWIVSDSIVEVAGNIPSIYALFPFEQNWNWYLKYRFDPETTLTCSTYSATMNVLGSYMPNWNHTLASRVMAHRSELFPNGNHITNSVDSYYIVGTGEETSYQTCGIPDNLMHPTEFSMFSLYKNNLGDGTVTQYSATIGNTTPSNKTYYKHGSSTMSASHVGMITGESNDYSTLNFIVVLINGTVNQVPESYLNSQYGIYR